MIKYLKYDWILRDDVSHINDILLYLSGLSKKSFDPYIEKVELYFPKPDRKQGIYLPDEPDEYLNLDELMYRYPPFEALSYPTININNHYIRGFYAWFPENYIKNYKNFIERIVERINNKYGSINLQKYGSFGFGQKIGTYVRISKLVIPPIPLISKRGNARIEISDALSPGITVEISYGFDEKLYRSMKTNNICTKEIKYLNRELDKLSMYNKINYLLDFIINCSKKMNLRYNPTNFTYVNYCNGGRYMSNDPLAHIKVPCVYHQFSKYSLKGPGYSRFHYRKTVFPKVYPIADVEIKYHPPAMNAPAEVIRIDKLKMKRVYRKAIINFRTPRIESMNTALEPSPMYELPATNGILLLIKPVFLKVGGLLLLGVGPCLVYRSSPGSDKNCNENIKEFFKIYGINLSESLKIKPSTLLLTKFWFYKNGFFKAVNKLVDALKSNKIKKIYKDLDKIYSEIFLEYSNKSGFDREQVVYNIGNKTLVEFLDYYSKTVTHTISHIMLIRLGTSNIPIGYLSPVKGFVYDEDGAKIFFAGLIEKSSWGTLNISKSIEDFYLGTNVYSSSKEHKDILYILLGIVRDMILHHSGYYISTEKWLGEDEIWVSKKLRCDAIKTLLTLYDSYGPEEKSALIELVKWVNDLLINFLRNEAGETQEYLAFDKFLFDFIVHQIVEWKKEKISEMLMRNYRLSLETAKEIVDKVLRESIDQILLAAGPDFGLDGSSYSIHLDKGCSEGVLQPLTTSKISVLYFLAALGMDNGKACGPLSLSGTRIFLEIIESAESSLVIETPFLTMESISFLDTLLSSKSKLKIKLKWDGRVIGDCCKPETIEIKLKELVYKYSGRFSYKIPDYKSHEKRLITDRINIETSWNFLIPPSNATTLLTFNKGPTKQNYNAKLL